MSDDKYIRIPHALVGVIVAIVLQTLAAVWWAATLNTKFDGMQKTVTTLTNDRYTSMDAAKDLMLRDSRLDELKIRLENMEKAIYPAKTGG